MNSRYFRIRGRRLLESAFYALPDAALRKLEVRAQQARGKGYVSNHTTEVRAALSLLPASARAAPVVFDVGANRGSWTSELLNQAPSAEVHCFEPSAVAFRQLAQALDDDNRVTLAKTALGGEVGDAVLFADTAGSGLASLTRRRLEHFGREMALTESVSITTLDLYSEQHGIRPDLIKIDVEGHEMDVLQGAQQSLESVPVVQFEFGGTHIDTRMLLQDFWYFFTERGFRLSRLAPRSAPRNFGLHPVTSYSERDECFVMSNFFAHR